MKIRWRHVFLCGALAATLVAVWWSLRLPKDEEVMVENTERSKRVVHPDKPPGPTTVETVGKENHSRLSLARLDAFAIRDWTPPPPPQLAPLPPPPKAPPLPYRYLGKLQEHGQLTVFLDDNSRPIPVRGGEVLDGQWRVEEVTPRLVRFTYIPLAQTATLSIGEAL